MTPERSAVFLSLNGRRMLLTEWAREARLSPQGLRYRIRQGMPLEGALSKPSVRPNHLSKTVPTKPKEEGK